MFSIIRVISFPNVCNMIVFGNIITLHLKGILKLRLFNGFQWVLLAATTVEPVVYAMHDGQNLKHPLVTVIVACNSLRFQNVDRSNVMKALL